MQLHDGKWLDWGRQYPAEQSALATPRSLDELKALVADASGTIRPIGAGHSFSPVVAGGETVVSLDGIKGVESIDKARGIARIRAGSRLREISTALHEQGFAFANLGDIDVQSIAGATATATHGTGRELPCLSAQIEGLSLITADGSAVDIDGEKEPDLLRAARVSLGAIGIVTHVDFRVIPSHRLHRRTWSEPLKDMVASAFDRWRAHRNFEFYYIPFSDYCLGISHDITEDEPRPGPKGDEDKAVRDLKMARDWLGWSSLLRTMIIRRELSRFPAEDAVDYNWKLLATERGVPFREMEYHLPVEAGLDVLQEVIRIIESKRRDVFIPIEVRQTAGDDAWLSPFQGDNRISIAIHSYWKDDHDFMHALLEPVFLAAGGRPHWGKMHQLGKDKLTEMYPDFGRFAALREEWDPRGKFLNPLLEAIFGAADGR